MSTPTKVILTKKSSQVTINKVAKHFCLSMYDRHIKWGESLLKDISRYYLDADESLQKDCLGDFSYNMETIAGLMEGISSVNRKLPLKSTIIDEIVYLVQKDHVKIYYDYCVPNRISFDIGDIYLKWEKESIKFPNVQVQMFTHIEDVSFPQVIAICEKAGRFDGRWHPHTSSHDELCLGDGVDAFDQAFWGGRLKDALDIVEAVLKTYSPDNAYIALEDLIRSAGSAECWSCGCVNKEVKMCVVCDSFRCKDCNGHYSINKNWVCSEECEWKLKERKEKK